MLHSENRYCTSCRVGAINRNAATYDGSSAIAIEVGRTPHRCITRKEKTLRASEGGAPAAAAASAATRRLLRGRADAEAVAVRRTLSLPLLPMRPRQSQRAARMAASGLQPTLTNAAEEMSVVRCSCQ